MCGIGIHIVATPFVSIIVDVGDKKPVPVQRSVESHQLAVFQHVVLITVVVVVEDIGFCISCQWLHILDISNGVEFHRVSHPLNMRS